jgi:hypothetical protein
MTVIFSNMPAIFCAAINILSMVFAVFPKSHTILVIATIVHAYNWFHALRIVSIKFTLFSCILFTARLLSSLFIIYFHHSYLSLLFSDNILCRIFVNAMFTEKACYKSNFAVVHGEDLTLFLDENMSSVFLKYLRLS